MNRHLPGNAARALRILLLSAVLATSVATAPASALASRRPSDVIGTTPLSSGTVSSSKAPDISARSGRLVTWQGRPLWSRGASVKRKMASTTKVMTALVVLESVNLTESVHITRSASRTPYGIGLRTGEKRTVRQLLEYLLVRSSNDAATALAIHVAGSVPAFAERMNAKAKELGLNNTHFVNPHGLDATGHYTSASDLAKLMKVAMQKSEFRRIVSLRRTTLPAYGSRPRRVLQTTNKLFGEVVGLRGGKTGFTGGAGFTYVANAKRNGVTLTVTVLGSSSSAARFESARRLFEWGFKHYKLRSITTTKTGAGYVPIAENPALRVPARFAEATSAAVFDLGGPITKRPSTMSSVTVPVYKGQPLGSVVLTQESSVLATVPIVATTSKASAEETLGTIPVAATGRSVTIRTAESTAEVPPFDSTRPVDKTIDVPETIPAPVSTGQVVGSVTYSQDGIAIVTVPIIAAEDVSEPEVSSAAGLFLRHLIRETLSIPALTRQALLST